MIEINRQRSRKSKQTNRWTDVKADRDQEV